MYVSLAGLAVRPCVRDHLAAGADTPLHGAARLAQGSNLAHQKRTAGRSVLDATRRWMHVRVQTPPTTPCRRASTRTWSNPSDA